MDEITTTRLTIEIGASSDNARREINRVTDALSRLRGNTNHKIRVDAKDVDKAHKKVGLLANALNSLKRIAFYRVIRSAIKAVGDAMQEGQTNAYWYAKSVGDSTKYIADAYDSLASSGFTMQNQLGAAWATLKATVAPVLIEIAQLATMAAQAITQFFAALGGKSTYLKAIDYSKEWADTTAKGAGAAKEWKNQLMGFDEINRLEEPSSGGGGGGSALPDYENMFEEADIEGFWKKLSDLASEFKINFKDVFFNWDDLNAEQIGKKLIVGLSGALGGITGFILGGVPGAIVGTLLGVGIGLIIDSLIFDHDGVLSKTEIGNMLCLALFGLVGGIIGFTLGGPHGALIGATIGVALFAAIKELNFFSNGKLNGVLESLANGMAAGLGGAIGFAIGGPGGAILGATIGLGISLMIQKFALGDTSKWSTADWIRNIVEVLAPIAGAAIGFAVGGPGGAAIGALIGLGITFSLQAVEFGKQSGSKKRGIDYFAQDVLHLPSDKEWKEWGKKAVDWLVQGFNDSINEAVFLFTGMDWSTFNEWLEDVGKKGHEAAEGFLQGISDGLSRAGEWVREHIWNPLVDGIKSVFGINSPAKNMKPYGEYVIEGFKEGITDAWRNIKQWCKDNIVDPFVNGVKDLLGIHSPSTVFAEIGSSIIDGLVGGISAKWNDVSSWISGIFGTLISWCQQAHVYLQDVLNGIGLVNSSSGSVWRTGGGSSGRSGQFASGGFPEDGLFMANHGELVGQFSNGKTAVANNEQITEGISRAVYEAFVEAFTQTGGSNGNGQAVNIYLDGKQIAQTTTKYQRQFARANG